MTGTILTTHDPYYNLALEDFFLHRSSEEYSFIYMNNPTLIVGKHQVIYREADIFAAEALNVPVIRRLSGGGTVYHDRGNLNFSLIRNSRKGMQVNFELHTKPVIDFLNRLEIPALLSGKSDIAVEGFKVSGNAEYVYRERVLHHGTLLFDTATETMKDLLRATTSFYTTSAVDSNRTRVMNLKGRIKGIDNIDELAAGLYDAISRHFGGMDKFLLSDQENSEIISLADSKYKSWDWNYGFSPAYEFSRYFEAYGLTHRISMYVKDGIIWKCTIEGSDAMALAAKQMIGCRHLPGEIKKIFEKEKMKTDDELITFFF